MHLGTPIIEAPITVVTACKGRHEYTGNGEKAASPAGLPVFLIVDDSLETGPEKSPETDEQQDDPTLLSQEGAATERIAVAGKHWDARCSA